MLFCFISVSFNCFKIGNYLAVSLLVSLHPLVFIFLHSWLFIIINMCFISRKRHHNYKNSYKGMHNWGQLTGSMMTYKQTWWWRRCQESCTSRSTGIKKRQCPWAWNGRVIPQNLLPVT